MSLFFHLLSPTSNSNNFVGRFFFARNGSCLIQLNSGNLVSSRKKTKRKAIENKTLNIVSSREIHIVKVSFIYYSLVLRIWTGCRLVREMNDFFLLCATFEIKLLKKSLYLLYRVFAEPILQLKNISINFIVDSLQILLCWNSFLFMIQSVVHCVESVLIICSFKHFAFSK